MRPAESTPQVQVDLLPMPGPEGAAYRYQHASGEIRRGVVASLLKLQQTDRKFVTQAVKGIMSGPITLNESGDSNSPYHDNPFILRDELQDLLVSMDSAQLLEIGTVVFNGLTPQVEYKGIELSKDPPLKWGHMIGFDDDLEMKRKFFMSAAIHKARAGDTSVIDNYRSEVQKIWGEQAVLTQDFKLRVDDPHVKVAASGGDIEPVLEKWHRSAYGFLDLIPQFTLSDGEKLTLFKRLVPISGHGYEDWEVMHPVKNLIVSMEDETVRRQFIEEIFTKTEEAFNDMQEIDPGIVGEMRKDWDTPKSAPAEVKSDNQKDFTDILPQRLNKTKGLAKRFFQYVPDMIAVVGDDNTKSELFSRFRKMAEGNVGLSTTALDMDIGDVEYRYSYDDSMVGGYNKILNSFKDKKIVHQFLNEFENWLTSPPELVQEESVFHTEEMMRLLEPDHYNRLGKENTKSFNEYFAGKLREFHTNVLQAALRVCVKKSVPLKEEEIRRYLERERPYPLRDTASRLIPRIPDFHARDQKDLIQLLFEREFVPQGEKGHEYIPDCAGVFAAAVELPQAEKKSLSEALYDRFVSSPPNTELFRFVASIDDDGMKQKILGDVVHHYITDRKHFGKSLDSADIAIMLRSIKDDGILRQVVSGLFDALKPVRVPLKRSISRFRYS